MKKHRKGLALLLTASLCLSTIAPAFAADYTVVKGDSLWKIAKQHLKTGTRWGEIYEANRDTISNPNRIQIGQILHIPETPDSEPEGTTTPAPDPAPAPEPEPEPVPAAPEIDEATAALLSTWTDNLYEPDTQVALPATIVWPADAGAVAAAQSSVRPNTMIVAVDKNLKVTTLDGAPLAEHLVTYLAGVKSTTLPALYIRDQATADALTAFCTENNVQDIFVVASSANRALVRQVSLACGGVLGIVDWSDASIANNRAGWVEVVRQTNASNAKIAILPESAVTRESADYMRTMLITVWAKTAPTTQSIYTQLTNGVNGIVCDDYAKVASALETFSDKTTLLRQTFITGHRGMPGAGYIENTIKSELAAVAAGANVIECDVSLSKDGQLFVLHDDTIDRLMDESGWLASENGQAYLAGDGSGTTTSYSGISVLELTMDELSALPYDWDEIANQNHTNTTQIRHENMDIGEDGKYHWEESDIRIPTFEQYLDALDDENIFHFIEIKCYDPAVVGVLKEICERRGITDRMCVITFNDGNVYDWSNWPESWTSEFHPEMNIMEAMHTQWPEMSLGFLAGAGYGFEKWGEVGETDGSDIQELYETLKPYNATYNTDKDEISKGVVFSGRHRGLTTWPWTYNEEEAFADHYLFGIYSLTTNFSWWASELPVKITAKGGDSYEIQLQNGTVLTSAPEGMSVEKVSIGDGLSMWKLNANLNTIGGINVVGTDPTDAEFIAQGKAAPTKLDNADYAIYSNPFAG